MLGRNLNIQKASLSNYSWIALSVYEKDFERESLKPPQGLGFLPPELYEAKTDEEKYKKFEELQAAHGN